MCNNMKNISMERGNRIDIIRFWSLMSLISLKPSIAEEFFGSWWPTASWWYFGFLKLEWHFMTRNSYNFKRERRNQLAPKLASKLSTKILPWNFVRKVKSINNGRKHFRNYVSYLSEKLISDRIDTDSWSHWSFAVTHALFGKMELPPSTLPTDLRHMELTILIEYQSLWNVGGEELSAWANSAPWMPGSKARYVSGNTYLFM